MKKMKLTAEATYYRTAEFEIEIPDNATEEQIKAAAEEAVEEIEWEIGRAHV